MYFEFKIENQHLSSLVYLTGVSWKLKILIEYGNNKMIEELASKRNNE